MTQIEVFAYKAFFIGAAVVLALFIWMGVGMLLWLCGSFVGDLLRKGGRG